MGHWFYIAPIVLLAGVILALFGPRLFEWETVYDTGVWRYQQNVRTGKRRLRIGGVKGHQPVNERWLKGGSWDAAWDRAIAQGGHSVDRINVEARSFIASILCLLFISAIVASPAAAATLRRGYHPKAVRVVDGDTIVVTFKAGPRTIRAVGYDTPELHIACEHDRAVAAKDEMSRLAALPRFMVRETGERDKYGRRLARLMVGSADVSAILIVKGLAQPYSGKGPRQAWKGC